MNIIKWYFGGDVFELRIRILFENLMKYEDKMGWWWNSRGWVIGSNIGDGIRMGMMWGWNCMKDYFTS